MLTDWVSILEGSDKRLNGLGGAELAQHRGGGLTYCSGPILEGGNKRGDSLRGVQLPQRYGCTLAYNGLLILKSGDERLNGLGVA